MVRFHNVRACVGRGTKGRYVCVVLPGSQNKVWFKLLFQICCHSAVNGKKPRTCSSLDLAMAFLSLKNSAGLARVLRVETYSFGWTLQKAAAGCVCGFLKAVVVVPKQLGPAQRIFRLKSWAGLFRALWVNHLLLGTGGTYSVELESSKMGDHTWVVCVSVGSGEKQ